MVKMRQNPCYKLNKESALPFYQRFQERVKAFWPYHPDSQVSDEHISKFRCSWLKCLFYFCFGIYFVDQASNLIRFHFWRFFIFVPRLIIVEFNFTRRIFFSIPLSARCFAIRCTFAVQQILFFLFVLFVFSLILSLARRFVGSLSFGRILVVVASSDTLTKHHCFLKEKVVEDKMEVEFRNTLVGESSNLQQLISIHERGSFVMPAQYTFFHYNAGAYVLNRGCITMVALCLNLFFLDQKSKPSQ